MPGLAHKNVLNMFCLDLHVTAQTKFDNIESKFNALLFNFFNFL